MIAVPVALALSLRLARAEQIGIAQPAVSLLNELVSAPRSAFFVYQNSDSGLNHSFPSGWFPGGSALTKIHLDTACVYDPASPSGCTVDPNRLDRVRGTVTRITWDPLLPGEFAGINYEEPENYGVNRRGVGYDLRGATRGCLEAFSPTPSAANFKVQFAVAQRITPFMSVPALWTEICFDLASLGLTPIDLTDVHFPFTVVTNGVDASAGGTILLDNIRFEPVPFSQQSAISFPQANEALGVLPATDVQPGRVKIPPDQVLANLSTIYESAMTVLTLLRTGNASDAASARFIADAFVYALDHDNQGLPIPLAPDGSAGLHNGMFSGDLPLFNDQGPGAGRRGEVRLAGFSIASGLCGASHFCLVLDGATGGNNAFVMLALAEAYKTFQDSRYLDAARTIGNWIHQNLLDTSGTGFGGYYLGYPDEGQAKQLLTGKSIENNADIFRAFVGLADIARGSGLIDEADEWTRRARIAGDFVMAMFDSAAGRFYAGTVPEGVPASPGISPDGPQRGIDIINTYDFLDAQTFTTLPLASSQFYRDVIDWRRPIQWMVDHYAQSATVGGLRYEGFSLVAASTEGPVGIAWEFTGQAVVAMRFVDQLYRESGFEAKAQFYLDEIRKAQQSSPFADSRGLVAATLQDGDQIAPYEQCLSTPFQCIAARVGLAATTWAILADLNINPFVPSSAPEMCAYSLSKTSASVRGSGSSVRLSLMTKIGCAWTGTSNAAWAVISPISGTGSATLVIRLERNPARKRRSTTLEIAGMTFALRQAGTPPADLNGDGHPDLIWQHANGRISVWLMNGIRMIHDPRYGGSGQPIPASATPLIHDWIEQIRMEGIVSVISFMHDRDLGRYREIDFDGFDLVEFLKQQRFQIASIPWKDPHHSRSDPAEKRARLERSRAAALKAFDQSCSNAAPVSTDPHP